MKITYDWIKDHLKTKFNESQLINKLTDISSDASVSINQQFVYDSELFEAQSQKDLLNILREELDTLKYKLLPVNIGLNSNSLNSLISQYNVLIKERNTLIGYGAGVKNSLVINKESQINNFYNNILTSIENYRTSLEVSIDNIIKKETLDKLIQITKSNHLMMEKITEKIYILI